MICEKKEFLKNRCIQSKFGATLSLILLALIGFTVPLKAQDLQDDLLGGLMEELGAGRSAVLPKEVDSSETQRFFNTVLLMKSVSAVLISGRVSDETLDQQAKILEDIDSLIEAMKAASSDTSNKQSEDNADESDAEDLSAKTRNLRGDDQQAADVDDSSRINSDSLSETNQQSDNGSSIGNESSQNGDTSGTANSGLEKNRPFTDMPQQIWGRLPEQVREQARGLSFDDFPRAYRDAIQEYYRRLAEEK